MYLVNLCTGISGLPHWPVVKNLPATQEPHETLVPLQGQESPWRKMWQPTPGFLPGESHGQRSLGAYSPWGLKRVRHD